MNGEDELLEAFKKGFYGNLKIHAPIFAIKNKKLKLKSKCGSLKAKHFGSFETVTCKKCLLRIK